MGVAMRSLAAGHELESRRKPGNLLLEIVDGDVVRDEETERGVPGSGTEGRRSERREVALVPSKQQALHAIAN